jgi:hypothetical protein
MSHLLKDYLELGLSDIVVVDHKDREELSGNQNEHTWETVVARQGDKSVKVSVYELQKFGWGVGRNFSVESSEEISNEEYRALTDGKEIIDTAAARQEIEDRHAEWLKREQLRDQLNRLAPKCPKCSGPMGDRDGPYGPFWGCGDYPNCDGSRKMSAEEKKLYNRWSGKEPL